MKISYQFCNETIEIEVDEEWANVLHELDRVEYNANHRETRRHCSLDALNLDDAFLPSEDDTERDAIRNIEAGRLHEALAQLEHRQRYLIEEIYLKERRLVDLAAELGIDKSAVRHALDRALKRLKKILE